MSPVIVDLARQPEDIVRQAAALLADAFPGRHGWPTIERAREEIAHIAEAGFLRAALDNGELAGWIGALPEYDGLVWELHPLVVAATRRRAGLGRLLVASFEAEAAARGGLTAVVGADDDDGRTSLSNVDLYADLPRQLSALRDLGRGHAFLFYRALGYSVTGVVPDANGPGRPDILMAKRLTR